MAGYTIDYYSDYRLDYRNKDNTMIAGGVYAQRMQEQERASNSLTPSEKETQDMEALKEQLKGVTVTISPESMAYFDGLKEGKEAQKAEQERIRQEYASLYNPENPFDRIGTQFSVFDDALAEWGAFDNMSDEEVLEAENLLGGITYGMNNLGVGHNLKESESAATEMTSYAARFELESSTAALRQFSQKYVPAAKQDLFDKLIDQYYEHNEKMLEGYRSTREYMMEGQVEIYETTAHLRETPLQDWERYEWTLGKVKHEKSDYEDAAKSWRESLKKMIDGEKSVDDTIAMMNDTMNALATGNSRHKGLLQYVSRWNAFTVENARQYWGLLIS